jgi:argininosuccinate synthase
MHLRDSLVPKFASLIYNGFWFSPEMQVLRALIDESQKGVNGTARVKLYKGTAGVAGRKSANSLYNPEVASFETFATYNSRDAEGFIRMNGFRLAQNKSLRKFLQ